jgi:hypothetical protein
MFLKVKPHILSLCRGILNLPKFNTIQDVVSYLERNYKVSRVELIPIVKQIYDSNLPNLFKLLKSGGGMCGYWAYAYYTLFNGLGYSVSVYCMSTSTSILHFYVRVDGVYDIDRASCCIVSCSRSTLTHRWYTLSLSLYKLPSSPRQLNPSADWLEQYERISKIRLPEAIQAELLKYTNAILSDIGQYTPNQYTDLAESSEAKYKAVKL